MNEKTLHDLQQKIRNLVHDFGLEYGIPGLVSVSIEANRITVEVKEWASGMSSPYDTSAGTEMYTKGADGLSSMRRVANESIYLDNEIGATEAAASSIHATYDPIHYADVGRGTAHLPIEDTLTEREQEDIKRRKDSEHTSDTERMTTQSDPLTTPPNDAALMYDGKIFNSQAEYENWLAQQKRTRR